MYPKVAEKWLELTEKTFAFATYARAAFLKANEMGKAGLELKKEILLALGKTPIITDQKLFIEPNEWFAEIQNGYPALEKKYLRLEPTKMPMNPVRNRMQTQASAISNGVNKTEIEQSLARSQSMLPG